MHASTVTNEVILRNPLLRRHRRRAGWWVPASAIGGAIEGVVASGLCWTFCPALPLVFGLTSGAALSLGVAWACYSVVAGVVIARILSHDVAFPSRLPSV